MIRLFLYSLAAIAAALLVIVFTDFPTDPGYLLIAFGDHTLETSLLALALAIAVVYLLFRLLRMLFGWANPWQWTRAGKRVGTLLSARRQSKTEQGMLALFRGNWQSAYNLLMQGRGERGAGPANHLLAAYAAHKLGQREMWESCIETVEQRCPRARSAAGILRAQLLHRDKRPEQALKALNSIRKTVLNDAALLGLLQQVHIDLENWDELEKLLPALEKNAAADQDEILRLRRHIFAQRLHALAVGRDARLDRETTLASLRQLWKKAPEEYRRSPYLTSLFAKYILRQDGGKDAAAAIEQALGVEWNQNLIALYGTLPLGDDARRLNIAEQWLENHPKDAELLLALGRLCLRNELWGKAREYLQQSLSIKPAAATHGELSRLLENLNEPNPARQHLNQYRKLTREPLPDLPQPPLPPTNPD